MHWLRCKSQTFFLTLWLEPEKKNSEEKKIPEPVKQVPTIKFTDEMREQRYIHELCTYILDIGLKAPYVYHFIYS